MNKNNISIVLTGGGTGGHIYPALAIAGGIKSVLPRADITFIGTEKGLEKEIVPRAGYALEFISAAGMERKLSFKSIITLKKGFIGVGQAARLLRKLKPSLVIGTGGFVSGPVVLAAAMMGIKTIIHEQNAYPGITNKILNPIVTKVLLTFSEAQARFRRKNNLIQTGLPLRKEIINVTKAESLKALAIEQDKKVIVVVGGSRGAKSINTAMIVVHNYFQHNKDIHILHITGESDYHETLKCLKDSGIYQKENIDIRPYMHDIKYALAAADLIVGRAGASFISEILGKGIPSILIPYPFAAENHQYWNAMSLVKAGAAEIINDKDLTGEVLLQSILGIMQSEAKTETMHKAALSQAKTNALELIIAEILKLL